MSIGIELEKQIRDVIKSRGLTMDDLLERKDMKSIATLNVLIRTMKNNGVAHNAIASFFRIPLAYTQRVIDAPMDQPSVKGFNFSPRGSRGRQV